jgi:hypothetical protein
MAGNESDLLKQATQAMMSRYEGEYRFPFTLGHSTRYIELFVRNFFCKMLYAMDIWADLAPCWCFPVSFVSSDDVFSTCLNVKVDEEGSRPAAIGAVIEAAIGD